MKPEIKTVAVVTSTIGSPDLERTIESVRTQTVPCKHYLFIDGVEFLPCVEPILAKYSEVTPVILPVNMGAGGWKNSTANAIAPFMLKEDVICYLDDDNWFEPNHIESGLDCLNDTQADYAFALRNLYAENEQFICQDIIESIGDYQHNLPNPFTFEINISGQRYACQTHSNRLGYTHIDTNCYFVRREIALKVSHYWYHLGQNDTHFYQGLKEANAQGVCTKAFTVNYQLEPQNWDEGLFHLIKQAIPNPTPTDIVKIFKEVLQLKNQQVLKNYEGYYPWDKEKLHK